MEYTLAWTTPLNDHGTPGCTDPNGGSCTGLTGLSSLLTDSLQVFTGRTWPLRASSCPELGEIVMSDLPKMVPVRDDAVDLAVPHLVEFPFRPAGFAGPHV